jgi:hypothetical protein
MSTISESSSSNVMLDNNAEKGSAGLRDSYLREKCRADSLAEALKQAKENFVNLQSSLEQVSQYRGVYYPTNRSSLQRSNFVPAVNSGGGGDHEQAEQAIGLAQEGESQREMLFHACKLPIPPI